MPKLTKIKDGIHYIKRWLFEHLVRNPFCKIGGSRNKNRKSALQNPISIVSTLPFLSLYPLTFELLPFSFCPMPYTPLAPLPYAPCPLPYTPCPLPYAPCPLPYALCPLPPALCVQPFILYPLTFCLLPFLGPQSQTGNSHPPWPGIPLHRPSNQRQIKPLPFPPTPLG